MSGTGNGEGWLRHGEKVLSDLSALKELCEKLDKCSRENEINIAVLKAQYLIYSAIIAVVLSGLIGLAFKIFSK